MSIFSRLRSFQLLLALMAAALGGCVGDSTGVSSPVGTYQLVLIDGQPLPQVLFGAEVLAGTLTLHADRRYTAELTTRRPDPSTGAPVTETMSDTGTYVHSGSAMTFSEDGGTTITGIFEPDRIVLNTVIARLTFER